MTPGKHDLDLYRGDSYEWLIRLWSDDMGTLPLDLAGATVTAQIRDKPDGTKVVNMGTAIEAPNAIRLTITPALWATAPAESGQWDLQVIDADGEVTTVLAGKVKITADITVAV